MKAAILTYHSQNVAGEETGINDHVALAADLEAMHAAGLGHTFESANNDIVFKQGSTDNYMDYDNEKETTWQWQWQRLHGSEYTK